MSADWDAIIVGAGPAGSVCAAHLAAAGRRVLLLDKARFPRDKVCGDCLNPEVLPLLARLDLREKLERLPHRTAREVSFHGMSGESLSVAVPARTEFIVKRREFDQMLVARAVELGAEFRDTTTVTRVAAGWRVDTSAGSFRAPRLIAADGRNSTVARLVGLLPDARRERVAIQCHCPRPEWHTDAIRMLFYREGYGGTAAISETEINVCLVAPPEGLEKVRGRVEKEFSLGANAGWQSIAPLRRGDARHIAADGLFLVGDAARVVEPFTGEGIYYAMRSGELTAEAILRHARPEQAYRRAHMEMYRGRLWINRLAQFAGGHPRMASLALRALRRWPAPLEMLTRQVVAQT